MLFRERVLRAAFATVRRQVGRSRTDLEERTTEVAPLENHPQRDEDLQHCREADPCVHGNKADPVGVVQREKDAKDQVQDGEEHNTETQEAEVPLEHVPPFGWGGAVLGGAVLEGDGATGRRGDGATTVTTVRARALALALERGATRQGEAMREEGGCWRWFY